MAAAVIGIDIAKASFQVTLLEGKRKFHRTFQNKVEDFPTLLHWLGKHEVIQAHVCMEATGRWYEQLARFLFEQNFVVSVVNPARIRYYAQSKLIRNKTDKVDGDVIADFCLSQKPESWTPKPLDTAHLSDLVRLYDDLIGMQTQTINRLKSGVTTLSVINHLQDTLTYLTKQLNDLLLEIFAWVQQHDELRHKRDLLLTIKGIGEKTAARLLADQIDKFHSTRELVAYAGLNPQSKQSGTSINGKPRLSKMGSRTLRKTMYFPAMSARRTNPIVKTFCDRLADNGKCKMSVIGAAMRKLLCIAFGVLKSGKPFDPHYRQ